MINRITKYKENFFQHIYPIVPIGNGKYITMDCVVDNFNYEEPYSEKKDYNMDLQFLDGIDEKKPMMNVDAQDLFGWEDEMGDLGKRGKLFSKNTSAMSSENGGAQGKRKGFQKFKTVIKRVSNVANKANPAAALLRVGILASMKLNIMKVAQRLKWAYLSETEAQQKGADMSKFGKMKKILYKIEQIFFTAGGKPENLKKAILTGKGNHNKEVALGYLNGSDNNLFGMNELTPMRTLLGTDVYYDEFVNGLEGTEELGSAVATGAAITAATTVMTAIAGLLKGVGNLFPKKKNNIDFKEGSAEDGGSTESNSDGSDNSSQENNSSNENPNSSSNSSSNSEEGSNSNSESSNKQSSVPSTQNESSNTPANNQEGTEGAENTDEGNANARKAGSKGTIATNTTDEPKKGFKEFWENNKKWIKPVGIGVGVISALALGYKAWKKNKESKGTAVKSSAGLNGVPKKRKAKKGKAKPSIKKSNIAMM
ncbi:MAG: hypothetical protein H0U95_05050 [Bacteroidetes bacterium]|nr:hypothetical protein [Bacteroidota bacterium]